MKVYFKSYAAVCLLVLLLLSDAANAASLRSRMVEQVSNLIKNENTIQVTNEHDVDIEVAKASFYATRRLQNGTIEDVEITKGKLYSWYWEGTAPFCKGAGLCTKCLLPYFLTF